jgi:hypothetical protein
MQYMQYMQYMKHPADAVSLPWKDPSLMGSIPAGFPTTSRCAQPSSNQTISVMVRGACHMGFQCLVWRPMRFSTRGTIS